MAILRVSIDGDARKLFKDASPPRKALGEAFYSLAWELAEEIEAKIERIYEVPRSFFGVVNVTRPNTQGSVSLEFKNEPINLAEFPTRQKLIISGKKKWFETYVRVKKSGGFKLVEGTATYGYRKGWKQKGNELHAIPTIYERNQKKTWLKGQRLPFHALYGPSIAQMVRSDSVQATIDNSRAVSRYLRENF